MTAVAFDDVSLALGGRTVLAGARFAIADGEFVGLLGPNGAGKTTLMRAILGLLRPSSGTIAVLDRPPARGNSRIGTMPQSRSAAGAGLIGRDLVASASRGHRWGLPILSRADRTDVERALDLVGATALATRPVTALSGGELQRLLLAQALLGQPRLLLLDEPLMSLDPRHQRGVVTLVRRLQRELGIAVLFSAHEINPLLGALDRVLYLGGGRATLGTVAEVINGPALTRLFGSPIEVAEVNGRVFVMAGGADV